MDVNSNKYTFLFSIVLIVVAGLLLALAAEGLKPYQNENVKREKMQNILSAVGIEVSAEKAEETFNQYIVEQVVLDGNGMPKTTDRKAFDMDILKDYKSGLNTIYAKYKHDYSGMRAELIKFGAEYPIFVCKKEDGTLNYIIPLVGKGLWGPIWGYVAIGSDKKTCTGASFDHKSETPGLGAEINTPAFENPFIGKKIFDESGNFTSIRVVKGGAADDDPHGVDAISGGTITSMGLHEMVYRTLSIYEPYFKDQQTSSINP
jgi:Na+-transporting NADH:ubiquinone oxidoreductase subunit C